MKKIYTLFTLLILLASKLIGAEIVHTVIVPETLGNWAVVANVPKFNLTNTLTGVKLELYNSITNIVKYENRDPGLRGVVRNNLEVVAKAESPILRTLEAKFLYATTNNVAPFDGLLDYSGTSGFRSLITSKSADQSIQTNLADFIGTNTIPVSMSSVGLHQYNGPGDYTYVVSTQTQVLLRLIYTYDP